MLSSVPGHIAFRASQKYPGSQSNGLVVGVVKQRAERTRRTVVGVPRPGLQGPHVRINSFFGQIHGAIVILVSISGIAKHGVGKVLKGDFLFNIPVGIAVRAVGCGFQKYPLSGNQILNHMSAPVIEFAGIDLV